MGMNFLSQSKPVQLSPLGFLQCQEYDRGRILNVVPFITTEIKGQAL